MNSRRSNAYNLNSQIASQTFTIIHIYANIVYCVSSDLSAFYLNYITLHHVEKCYSYQ